MDDASFTLLLKPFCLHLFVGLSGGAYPPYPITSSSLRLGVERAWPVYPRRRRMRRIHPTPGVASRYKTEVLILRMQDPCERLVDCGIVDQPVMIIFPISFPCLERWPLSPFRLDGPLFLFLSPVCLFPGWIASRFCLACNVYPFWACWPVTKEGARVSWKGTVRIF